MNYEEAIALTEKRAAALRHLKANARQFGEQMAAKIEAAAAGGKPKFERFEPPAPAITLSPVKPVDGMRCYYGEGAGGGYAGATIHDIEGRANCYGLRLVLKIGPRRLVKDFEQWNVSARECRLFAGRKLAAMAKALGVPGATFELEEAEP